MNTLSAQFANGRDFLEEYRPFFGVLIVPKRGTTGLVAFGERVLVRCAFAGESRAHEWQGVVINLDEHTQGNDTAYAIKLDAVLLEDVEYVAWSHVRPRARRQSRLKPSLAIRLVVERAGSSVCQSLSAIDISSGGCQLEDEANELLADDLVTLHWGSGQTRARVRWVQGPRFGLMFAPSLPA